MTLPAVVPDAPGERSPIVVPVWSGNGKPALASDSIPSEIAATVDAAIAFASGHGFKAGVGDSVVVPNLDAGGAEAIVLAGLGAQGSCGPTEIRAATGAAIRRLSAYETATVLVHHALGAAGAAAAIEGALLATYRFDGYKKEPDEVALGTIGFPGASEDDLGRGDAGGRAAAMARDLINEPPSVLTPAALGERAEQAASEVGVKCEVWDEGEVERRGCGGIIAVGKGSSAPPRMIHLSYQPQDAAASVALVGKGITFDSGGLAIKDAKSMETMKTDMSGAAAVIAATWAAARLGLPIAVDTWVPAAENMTGDDAMRPGDVIHHHGGLTSEVLNPDAEGRLVLADALSLASEAKPDAIVDVATLTGSIVVALGKKVSGLFATTDDLREALIAAGTEAGEDLWPFPIHEPYRRDLNSEVADQKNIASRWGGAIYAALFLSRFVADGIPWAHLDIAGTARAESDSGYISRGGTGVGTLTLLRWLVARAGA